MLKKKNIAMAMAAVSVATPVAQVFAATEENNVVRGEQIAELIALVEEKHAVKYANVVENDTNRDKLVYTITYTIGSVVNELVANAGDSVKTSGATAKTIEQFKADVNAMKNGDVIDVTIADNGHEERNGKVYVNAIPEYVVENGDIKGLTTDLGELNSDYSVDSTKKVISDEEIEYTLEFKNKKDNKVEYTTTIAVGDKKLQFNKPIKDTDGKLVGFEKAPYGPAKKEADIEKRISKSVEKTLNVSALYNGTELTEEGKKLAELTMQAGTNRVDVKQDDAAVAATAVKGEIKSSDDNKVHTLKLFVTDAKISRALNEDVKDGDLAVLTIEATSKTVLEAFVDALTGYTVTADAQVGLIAGANRFETAVEISKARFADTASAVILVGENAIVDGLAAGPLATAKNAPILYTKKDSVHETTMTEINRLFSTIAGKTVYIVGGENVISKKVENELASKGLNIVRIAGANRVETSIEIAKEIGTDAQKDEAFIVGFNGEADAMSVSSIASYSDNGKVTPILVSGQNGLTEATKEYIVEEKMNDLDLIGGETVLTTEVEEQLKAMKISSERVAGARRQDTNAEVIAKYFPSYDDKVYVAKSDVLVDALAAAPLVSKDTMKPIVLATDKLSEKQETELNKITQGTVNKDTLIQVGHGIAKTVMNKIAELIK